MNQQAARTPKGANARHTAYHEAGHALVACVLHITFEQVTMESADGMNGHLTPIAPEWHDDEMPVKSPLDARHRAYLEDYVTMLLAGRASQRLAAKRIPQWHSGNDEAKARSYASSLSYNDFEDNRSHHGATRRMNERCRQAEACLAWLRIRAENLVNHPVYRQAIDALAEELVRRRTMSAEEVFRIVSPIIDKDSPCWNEVGAQQPCQHHEHS